MGHCCFSIIYTVWCCVAVLENTVYVKANDLACVADKYADTGFQPAAF